MLGDLSGVSKIFVITGRTDRRKTSDNTIRDLRQTIVNLEETIAELNRRFFGISSEHSKNISCQQTRSLIWLKIYQRMMQRSRLSC